MVFTDQVEYKTPIGYEIDFDLLQDFERCLDLQAPECTKIPCRVLGYGEISTVFEIQVEEMKGLAFKRMSIFESPEEMDEYVIIYQEYNRLLEEDVGLKMPPYGYAAFVNEKGRPIFYIIQKMLNPTSFGNKALKWLPDESIQVLFTCVLRELYKIWAFNQRQDVYLIGIDGQMSNWAIMDFDPESLSLCEGTPLLYLDTSTPFIRIHGVEQLDSELFLRAAPSFLAWILRLFFLQDVMDRYYDFHNVIIDVLANFYKEQRPELIPEMVPVANQFISEQAASLEIEPVDAKEVSNYYREDALIWSLYLSMRRLDRVIHNNILRREYPYILPGKIER
jgi:hypothetical protein